MTQRHSPWLFGLAAGVGLDLIVVPPVQEQIRSDGQTIRQDAGEFAHDILKPAAPDVPHRLAWKSLITGQTGHSQPMRRDAAESALRRARQTTPQLEHWIEAADRNANAGDD